MIAEVCGAVKNIFIYLTRIFEMVGVVNFIHFIFEFIFNLGALDDL